VEHILPASIESLCGWLLSLPWVVERPGMAEATGRRWFAVDCEPLGRRRLWLLTGPLGDDATDNFGVHVVLPTRSARRIAAAGRGSVVAPIGGEHHLLSLRLDASPAVDAAQLERLLLLGYEACFT
jgi:hypothetical protein